MASDNDIHFMDSWGGWIVLTVLMFPGSLVSIIRRMWR